MKTAGLYLSLALVAAGVCAAVFGAGPRPLISAAEPRILLGGNLDDGRTLLVVEEAIPDVFPRRDGFIVPPNPDRPIYRCTVLIMSPDGGTASVAWSSLGRIEFWDGRIKPFEARMSGDVLVLTYIEANDVCAMVIRRAKDGSFTQMSGPPAISREIAGGMKTVAAHIEGDIADGSLCVSLDQRKDGRRGEPVCFRLLTHDGRDEWVRADPATTRPASRPAIGPPKGY